MNNISQNVEQTFQYYEGEHSGAYVFPTDNTKIKNVDMNQVKLNIYEGALVKELYQYFMIGYRSGISNDGIFYTDSNGREMIKRTQVGSKKRQTYEEKNVPSIYYPVNGRLILEGNGARMAVLNDRAQRGSSTEEGALELMLHRRLLRDDNLGVGEALNKIENGHGLVVRGKLYMILNSGRPFANIRRAVNANFSSLPEGIEVLSLELFMSTEILLHLEHLVDSLESAPITFDLKLFLMSLKAEEIHETTLNGNVLLKDMKRFKFPKGGEPTDKVEYYTTKHKKRREEEKRN
ncbi:hypothetical protein GQX74_011167 [Glossina fuscipes]|nr:hypothetical protein GQX74_011167 [Glossina fuscipes]